MQGKNDKNRLGATALALALLLGASLVQAADTGSYQYLNSDQPLDLDNGGFIDGIYKCQAEIAGKSFNTYLSMNGKSNGQTIYLVARMSATGAELDSNQFYGWGIGMIADGAFSGQTWNGQPFRLAALGLDDSDNDNSYDGLRLQGTVGLKPGVVANLLCAMDQGLF